MLTKSKLKTFFGPYIVREFRKNATEAEIHKGCPTFDEFARFVSEPFNYNADRLIGDVATWDPVVFDKRGGIGLRCAPAMNNANHW